MIFWTTHNSVCQSVAECFRDAGAELRHISEFLYDAASKHIFYGILRGAGNAIKICQHEKTDFYYVDNGYFDAEYINANGQKHMSGTYRVVKNALTHVYDGPYDPVALEDMESALLLPPSPYSAYFHDTTPADWLDDIDMLELTGKVRHKGDRVLIDDDIAAHDSVVAFNSMAVMRAAELRKPVWAHYGCLDRPGYYDYSLLKDYFADKQFTLEQIARGEWIS